MIYDYNNIKTVHLEITDKCNAACPMCGRNKLGGEDNPFLPDSDLTLEQCQKIFSPEFIANLDKMFMCGNYGDPVSAKDTLEVFRYFRDNNPDIRLGMNTNGSARKPEWWKELGSILNKKGSYCKFGIDGLGDTNHIYRRRTNFDRIIENMKAFIEGGGIAHWDFIVFQHNEHQVEEARALAAELGVKWFQVKKTGRFFSNTKLQSKPSQEVYDRNGNLEYSIFPPENPEYQNVDLSHDHLIQKYGSLDAYLDASYITCKTGQEKSIYVSSEGLIFPCCWTANQLYIWYLEERSAPIWKMIDAVGGKDAINATLRPLQDIIEGPFFEAIENSWGKESCKAGKLKVCAKTCGSELDLFKKQFA